MLQISPMDYKQKNCIHGENGEFNENENNLSTLGYKYEFIKFYWKLIHDLLKFNFILMLPNESIANEKIK